MPEMARANREFLGRAVRFLAGEAGIRQFLDLGTGLPTRGSVHQVAREITPDARVVYIDNDPMVLAHARALKTGEGTAVIQADLRDTAKILEHPDTQRLIDFSQPLAILLVAVLHFIGDRTPAGRGQLPRRRPARQLPGGVSRDQRRRPGHQRGQRLGLRQHRQPRARCAAARTSGRSSTAWTSWSPAWSPCSSGGPTSPIPTPTPAGPGTSAGSAASGPGTRRHGRPARPAPGRSRYPRDLAAAWLRRRPAPRGRRRPGSAGHRRERGDRGPDVRLLAGRARQLRRRPDRRAQGGRALAGGAAGRQGQPGVPGPGGAVPGRGGRHHPVPGPGHRAADGGNVHQVAQRITPDARVVYVDSDPWWWPTRGRSRRARAPR